MEVNSIKQIDLIFSATMSSPIICRFYRYASYACGPGEVITTSGSASANGHVDVRRGGVTVTAAMGLDRLARKASRLQLGCPAGRSLAQPMCSVTRPAASAWLIATTVSTRGQRSLADADVLVMACVPVHEIGARVGTARRDVVGLTDLDPPWLGRDDLAAGYAHAGIALLRQDTRRVEERVRLRLAGRQRQQPGQQRRQGKAASDVPPEGMAPVSFSSRSTSGDGDACNRGQP